MEDKKPKRFRSLSELSYDELYSLFDKDENKKIYRWFVGQISWKDATPNEKHFEVLSWINPEPVNMKEIHKSNNDTFYQDMKNMGVNDIFD